MDYFRFDDLDFLLYEIKEYGRLKTEYEDDGTGPVLAGIRESLRSGLNRLKSLEGSKALSRKEPESLEEIRRLRPDGPRRLWKTLPEHTGLQDKIEGALNGRFAGCLLGVPVESYEIERMQKIAEYCGMEFPPRGYWKEVDFPYKLQYNVSPRSRYTRGGMKGVPVDDDITYTILGLLILEKYGFGFTTSDAADMWGKLLPTACSAEQVALKNYRDGVPVKDLADIDNPYCQWIGADIRSDPWGYACAGCPEKAAELAYRDARLSHRRNGVYGEMFFSAAIAAAFAVNDAESAIRIGMTEIPRECELHRDIEWALETGKKIRNYKEAREAVDGRFSGMSHVNTRNNACLTVFGLMIGGNDFTKVIGETVAMGMDNDCTAATAGSIAGAILGKKGLPAFWYENFDDTVTTYMNHVPRLSIRDTASRFHRQLQSLYRQNG